MRKVECILSNEMENDVLESLHLSTDGKSRRQVTT